MVIYNHLLLESFIVGAEVVILTVVIRKLLNFLNIKLKNDYIILFVTGTLMHIISEFIGINDKYCKNGIACKKLQSAI